MTRADKKTIDCIIAINPMIYALQDKIEKEQEGVIADMTSPAKSVVKRLIELDNRRVDLCNLKVLFAFISLGLGDGLFLLQNSAGSTECDELYERAKRAIEKAGYSVARAKDEFSYLFDKLSKRKKKRTACGLVGETPNAAYTSV